MATRARTLQLRTDDPHLAGGGVNAHELDHASSKILRVARAGGIDVVRRGGQLVGLCAFHQERSPSMVLRPQIDAFHCFACGASGGYVDLASKLGVRLDEVLESEWTAPAPRPTKPPLPQPSRLERAQVVNLFSECRPVTADAEVSAWLRRRGFDVARVEERDLCRALPPELGLPSWARFEGSSWSQRPEAFRAIFALYSSTGRLEGLRARALAPTGGLKALAPIGGGASGLVLADELGHRVLAGDVDAVSYVRACAPETGLVIAEGEPDFLRWATNWGDGADRYPAVWGIVAGSWTNEIAARVPDQIDVLVATHADAAGDKYADAITGSLEERAARGRLRLFRWRPRSSP